MACQVNGDSREAVAFALMQAVLHAQGRGNQEHPFPAGSTLLRGQTHCSETEILNLYARCLRVVGGEAPDAVLRDRAPAAAPMRPASEGAPLHS